jgi:hypothetical protein
MSAPARNFLDMVPLLDHPLVQLVACIVMDAIGMCTYLIPAVGELADIVWAPITFVFIWALVGGEKHGMVMSTIGLVEELLPFTDVFPSCTFALAMKWFRW